VTVSESKSGSSSLMLRLLGYVTWALLVLCVLGIILSVLGYAETQGTLQQASDITQQVGHTVAPLLPPPWNVIVQGLLTLLSGIFALFAKKNADKASKR